MPVGHRRAQISAVARPSSSAGDRYRLTTRLVDVLAAGLTRRLASEAKRTGLVAGSASGTWGYRRELRGQWSRLRWQLPASFFGAGLGAWLLLHLPEKVFQQIVPVLLILALVLVVVGPRFRTGRGSDPRQLANPRSMCRPGRW